MEEKKEEPKQEQQSPNMVASAIEAANKLKAENDRMATQIKQLQELKAFEALGGKTEGMKQPEAPKEIDAVTYSRMVLEGKIPQKK